MVKIEDLHNGQMLRWKGKLVMYDEYFNPRDTHHWLAVSAGRNHYIVHTGDLESAEDKVGQWEITKFWADYNGLGLFAALKWYFQRS